MREKKTRVFQKDFYVFLCALCVSVFSVFKAVSTEFFR